MEQHTKLSRSRSRSPAESSDYPFMIVIPESFVMSFEENEGEVMQHIRDNTGISRIHFSPSLCIEGFSGGIAYIYD